MYKIMNLSEPHFTNIKKNIKTIEIRLYDKKRRQLKVNDYITFTKRENNNIKFIKKIKNIKIFKNFEDAIKDSKLKNCLPGINTYKKGVELYYSFPKYKKLEKKLGVIAIYI
jgi:ASC-1-like (ASCH) protein